MKNFGLLVTTLLATTCSVHAERVVVDKIVARVNGTNILQSDLELPRIAAENNIFSLDDAINDELMAQYAATMHVLPSMADIDRQLLAFKTHNGLQELSDEEFEKELKENGLTLISYKQQLGRRIAADNVKHIEMSEKIIVSAQEVEEYYQKNPEYTKEAYCLSIATVTEEQYEEKKESIPSDPSLIWEEHGFIETAELNDDYLGVKDLQPGQTMAPLHKDSSYELVKLIDKQDMRLKTLAERYNNIERTIQNKRKSKIVKNLEKTLREKATIVYLD